MAIYIAICGNRGYSSVLDIIIFSCAALLEAITQYSIHSIADQMAFYQMGPDTLQIPMEMFQENRAKVCNALQSSAAAKSAILLEGGQDISWYDTDVSYNFKQVCEMLDWLNMNN